MECILLKLLTLDSRQEYHSCVVLSLENFQSNCPLMLPNYQLIQLRKIYTIWEQHNQRGRSVKFRQRIVFVISLDHLWCKITPLWCGLVASISCDKYYHLAGQGRFTKLVWHKTLLLLGRIY